MRKRASNLWLVSGIAAAFVAVTLPERAHAVDVTLAWDPIADTDFTGYKVYYGSDVTPFPDGTGATEGASPIAVPLSVLIDPTAPQFTLHGLSSCVAYTYATTAYDANDPSRESAYSNIISHVPVAKPSAVTLGQNGGVVTVSWSGLPADDPGSLDGFAVEYGIAPGTYGGTAAREGASPLHVPASTSAQTLSGLPAGTTLYVRVVATCAQGATGASDEQTITVSTSPALCGNGSLEAGETCDPPSSCPARCDDNDSCTHDVLTGSAASCNAACSHSAVTQCVSGDDCCPAGCTPATDSDCPAGGAGDGIATDAALPRRDAGQALSDAGASGHEASGGTLTGGGCSVADSGASPIGATALSLLALIAGRWRRRRTRRRAPA